MTASTRLVACLSLLGFGACAESPTVPASSLGRTQLAVSHAPTGGTAGFYFLPPMVPDPQPFAGEFDAARAPTARVVCTGASGGSCPTIAAFQTGSSAGMIKVDPLGQSYGVVWQTPATLSLGRSMYRVEVFDGGVLLGSADLSVVAKQSDTKALPASEVGVVRGGTLHFKFRIEKSTLPPAVTSTISPDGGRVDVPLGGGTTATIDIPSGAVASALALTLTPKVPGPGKLATFVIQPGDILFLKPIKITVKFAAGGMPPTAKPAIALGTVGAPATQVLPTTLDGSTQTLTAFLTALGFPTGGFEGASRTQATRPRVSLSVAGAAADVQLDVIANVSASMLIAAFKAAADNLAAKADEALAADAFEAAIWYRTQAAALLQEGLDDPVAAANELQGARVAACAALDRHSALAETKLGDQFSNLWSALRPVLSWAGAAAEVGVVALECPPFAQVDARLNELALQFVDLYTTAVQHDAFPTNAEAISSELYSSLVARKYGELLGLPSSFAVIKAKIQVPLAGALRTASYDRCFADGEHFYLGKLFFDARRGGMYAPGLSELDRLFQRFTPQDDLGYTEVELSKDLHFCATVLSVLNKAPNGNLLGTLPLGTDPATDAVIPEQTFDVFPTGSIVVDGTLLAFACPDGSIGNDVIEVEFDGVHVRDLQRVAPTQAFIRNSQQTFTIQDLAAAASISPSDGGKHALKFYRKSDDCGSNYQLISETDTRRLLGTVFLNFQTVTISVSPPTATVSVGQAVTFGATVTGATTQVVTWSADGGTISAAGVFTSAVAGTFTVTASALADPAKKASATVTVTTGGGTNPPPAPLFSLLPVGAEILLDQPLRWRLNVTSMPNVTDIQWTISATPDFPIGDQSAFLNTSIVGPTATSEFNRRWDVAIGYPRTWWRGNIGYRVTVSVTACALNNGAPVLSNGVPLCRTSTQTP